MATTTQRGYGGDHQKLRAQAKVTVDAGQAWCWRCGRWIDPARPWDLGHDDTDRNIYRGPEHIRCNRATAKRGRAQQQRNSQNAQKLRTSRDW